MRVSVFGLGYVGCVTAACLAEAGHDVIGVDINPEKAAMLNGGTPPVVEPGLGELMASSVRTGRLKATVRAGAAVAASDLALICVGTPGDRHGKLEVSALEQVAREIGQALRSRTDPYTVVVRSTVLPGTTANVVLPALRTGLGRGRKPDVRLAFNPEFMREGSSIRDFASPPLTLVGCEQDETAGVLQTLYRRVDAPLVRTTVATAEMVKYVCNAFHALKICFANEVGDLCEALGADAQEVMRIFRMDRKLNISEAYLRPGFAFGGSCLPKDLRALLCAARGVDLSTPVLSALLPSNEAQIRHGVDAILETRKRRIGVVGLSFKPGTDDLRESPMVTLVETLVGKGCDVRILDSNVSLSRLVGANRRYIEEEIPHIASLMCTEAAALIDHADVLVIGNASHDADEVRVAARRHQIVIDLTRSTRLRHAAPAAAVA